MAEVEVHEVPPHSILLIRDLHFPEDAPDLYDDMADELAAGIGHKQFALMFANDGLTKLEVLTEASEFPDWLLNKLAQNQRVAEAAAERAAAAEPLTVSAVDIAEGVDDGGDGEPKVDGDGLEDGGALLTLKADGEALSEVGQVREVVGEDPEC